MYKKRKNVCVREECVGEKEIGLWVGEKRGKMNFLFYLGNSLPSILSHTQESVENVKR